MPNHVTNIITIEDEAHYPLKAIHSAIVEIIDNKPYIDFNKLVPMPECLKDYNVKLFLVSYIEDVAACKELRELAPFINWDKYDEALNKFKPIKRWNLRKPDLSEEYKDIKISENDKEDLERGLENLLDCGYVYWYDWCLSNWGTKWNAYSQPEGGWPEDTRKYTFDTAWSHPIKIIERISKLFPEITLKVQFADEDLGVNCGTYRMIDGTHFDDDILMCWKDTSPKERERFTAMAFKIKYGEDIDPRSCGYDENWDYSDEVYDEYMEEMSEEYKKPEKDDQEPSEKKEGD